MIKTMALTALTAVLAWTPIAGQQYTPSECAAIVASALSSPARTDTLVLLRDCPGSFGPTMATLLGSPSTYADSSAFDAVVFFALRRIEPEIFGAAVTLAGDASAPRLARLAGLAILIRYVAGSSHDFNLRQVPTSMPGAELCLVSRGTRAAIGDNPLPADAKQVASSLATAVRSSGADDGVRHLAQCLYAISTPLPPGAFQVPPPPETFVPSLHFQAEVLCGRRVRLRNLSLIPVSTRLVWGDNASQVNANNLARDYTLEGRDPGAASFETIWQVPSATATKFRIQQVANQWGAPPYVILHDIESLNTAACP